MEHRKLLEEAIAKSMLAYEEILFYRKDKRRLNQRIGELELKMQKEAYDCYIKGQVVALGVGILMGMFIMYLIRVII